MSKEIESMCVCVGGGARKVREQPKNVSRKTLMNNVVQRLARKWENSIRMGELGLRIWTRSE